VGVLTLVLISIFNNKTLQKPYWYLRPKINQVLFSNLFNVANLLFSLLFFVIIFLNFQEGLFNLESGLLGSIFFIMALPISYFIWMVFSQTNDKGVLEFSKKSNFKSFKNYEIYFVIILIAIIGIVYDYLPKSIEILLYLPTALLVILSIGNFYINHKTHGLLSKIFHEVNSEPSVEKVTSSTIIGLYERQPYKITDKLDKSFFQHSIEEQRYILYTLKRISAIDTLPNLELLIDLADKSSPHYSILTEIYEYLCEIEKKLSSIQNPYEYIEESNDTVVIKGLIRKLIKNKDKNLIIKLLNDNRLSINKPACIVAGYYNDINIISILIEQLGRPALNHWAQLALIKIGKKSLKYLNIEFSKRKENLLFVDSCFKLICKIEEEEGFELVFKSLNETNSNIRKIAAKKIIQYEIKTNNKHRKYFDKLFDDLILALLSNGYYLKQLATQNENFNSLKNAIENENKEALYLIINILKLYYNQNAIEKIFKSYGKESMHLHAAAHIIIDLITVKEISIRNKLKILFSPNEKLLLESLQEDFPSVNLQPNFNSEEDIIWNILKKEYDQINSWTRTCALNILQYEFREDIPYELASEFLNKNQLLKETAASNIYRSLPEFYTIFLSRLSENEASQIDYLIRSNLDVLNPKQINFDNLLIFDKISFLISIPYLKNLSISEIINFHKYFKPKVLKAGEHQISLKDDFNLGFWMIETGDVLYSKNGIDFYKYSKRDIIKVSDHDTSSDFVYFYLEQDTRFLIIEEIILMNIITDYDEIIQNYIDILPDKNLKKIITELNQNAA
jgi:flagellar motility protein MotE (MotC chaperone)